MAPADCSNFSGALWSGAERELGCGRSEPLRATLNDSCLRGATRSSSNLQSALGLMAQDTSQNHDFEEADLGSLKLHTGLGCSRTDGPAGLIVPELAARILRGQAEGEVLKRQEKRLKDSQDTCGSPGSPVGAGTQSPVTVFSFPELADGASPVSDNLPEGQVSEAQTLSDRARFLDSASEQVSEIQKTLDTEAILQASVDDGVATRASSHGDADVYGVALGQRMEPSPRVEVQKTAADDSLRASGRIDSRATDILAGSGRHVRRRLVNVHKAAQDGDVGSLRQILEERPADINLKNSATWQTPAHAAAASGQTEALELLLRWSTMAKADLEARNMYCETPLHTAAKGGHVASVRVLLEAGAAVNAQAANGMTPLHLAVWSATSAPEASMVAELLLQHHADLYAKDRSGRTPLDLLPSGSPRMSALLHRHVRRRQVEQAVGSLGAAGRVMEDLESELAAIVGVDSLKAQLRCWAKGMLLDQRRRALGLDIRPQRAPHMAFLGNPGTGKTTVARALARLLHRVGVLPLEKVVEVQRTDLVGEFVGHSGPKTRKVIERAVGGILFVDEAYRLIPPYGTEEKDYGLEALEEIMAAMDSGKLTIIFAGYAEPMQRLFAANEGFRRRVTKCFVFEDLTCKQIAHVMLLKMRHSSAASSNIEGNSSSAPISSSAEPTVLHGFRLHEECTEEALTRLILSSTTVEQRQKHNGALAVTVLISARDFLDARLDLDCCDPDELVTITLADIDKALALMPRN